MSRMRDLRELLLPICTVALLAGCGGGGGPAACGDDAECPGERLCRAGGCYLPDQVCGLQPPCAPDQRCDAGRCVAAAFCAVDAECGRGFVCKQNACVSGCRSDADCGAGRACNPRSRQCQPAGALGSEGCPRGQSADPATGLCAPIPAAECAGDDALEENDGPAQALPLGEGRLAGMAVCAGDPDWYAVTVPRGGSLIAWLRYPARGGELSLSLYDAGGESRLRLSVPAEGGRRLAVSGLPFGTWLLEVAPVGGAGNAYDLELGLKDGPLGCVGDGDCRGHERCDAERFECALRPGRCEAEGQCGPGERCDLEARRCVAARPCDADLLEPNDGASAAAALPLDPAAGGAAEYTLGLCQGDRDWMALELAGGQELRVELDYLFADAPIALRLFGPGADPRLPGEPLAEGEATDAGLRLVRGELPGGRYLLEVASDGSAAAALPYRLRLLLAPAPCADDRLEESDSIGAARLMPMGVYEGLRLCGDDGDYYAFDVAEASRVQLFVATDSPVERYGLRLLSESGLALAEGEARAGGAVVDYVPDRSRRVVLRVLLLEGDEAGYTLRASALPPPTPPPPPACASDDLLEDNDEAARARRVLAGRRDALVVCDVDEDWFAVHLLEGNFLRIELVGAIAEGTVRAQILAPGGRQVLAYGSSAALERRLEIGPAETGVHLVRIFVEGAQRAPYGMDLALFPGEPPEPPPPPPPPPPDAPGPLLPSVFCGNGDDRFEDNDFVEQARLVSAGLHEELLVCGDDRDFYAVRLAPRDRLYAAVGFIHDQADIDLKIRNPQGNQVLASSTLVRNQEAASYQVAEAGLYLVEVFVFGGSRERRSNYRMLIDVASPSPECGPGDDVYDAGAGNDDLAHAAALPRDAQGGLVVCADDPDVYRVQLFAGERAQLTLDFPGRRGSLALSLIAPDGETLLGHAETEESGPVELLHRVKESGGYYFKVALREGKPLRYDARMLVHPPPPRCPEDEDDGAPNQRPEEALALGTAARGQGRVVCDGAPDWYALQMSADDDATFSMGFDPVVGRLVLRAFDPEGVLLAESAPQDGRAAVRVLAPQGGRYLFEVAAEPGRAARYDYRLSVLTAPPACDAGGDDALEDNDTPSRGRRLAPGRYEPLAVCEEDPDFYCMNLARGELIDARVEFAHQNGDLELRLYDVDGATLLLTANAGEDSESVRYRAAFDGTHCVEVRAPAGEIGNYYALLLAVEPGAPPPLPQPPPLAAGRGCDAVGDDALEQNDGAGAARRIEGGAYRDLLVCPGDEDFYSVPLAPGDVIEVQTRSAGTDLALALLGPAGTPVGLVEEVPGGRTAQHVAGASGEHLVRVQSALGPRNYNMGLEVRVAPPDCAGRDDAFEPNDQISAAAELPLGTTAGLLTCAADSDYFQIHLEERDLLRVELAYLLERGEVSLQVIDVDRSTVLLEAEPQLGRSAIEFSPAQVGFYYLRVSAGAGDDGNFYDLLAEHVPARPKCATQDDRYEPNDTVAVGPELGRGSYEGLVVCQGDADHYRLFLSAGDSVAVALRFDHRNADVDLRLLAPDAATAVASSAREGTDLESFEYVAAGTGVYFIEVRVRSTGSTRYTLDLELSGSEVSGCVLEDDALEPNDTPESARPTAPGSHEALLACGDDPDHYATAVQALGRLDARITFNSAQADLALRLLRPSDGAVLEESDGDTGLESLSYRAGTEDEPVVLAVSAPERSEARYELQLELIPPCPSDDHENDDTAPAANPLADGDTTGLTVCSDDPDWFRVDMLQGERARIKLQAVGGNAGALAVQMFNSTGTELLATAALVAGSRLLDFTAPSAAAWRLRVTVPAGQASYGLQLLRTAPCPGDDNQEDNDLFTESRPLLEGTRSLSTCAHDPDYFHVDLQSGALLRVGAAYQPAAGRLSLTLLGESDFDLLQQSGAGAGLEQLSFVNDRPATQRVVLRVQPDEGQQIPYELEVDVQ